MAKEFEFIVDASEVWAHLGTHQDQVPYAMSLAINSCAFAARKSMFGKLPQLFHIRTKFVPSGLHVNRATKTHLGAAGSGESVTVKIYLTYAALAAV